MWVIYECDLCGEVYVEETEKSLRWRVEDHAKSIEKGVSKSAFSQHQERTGHSCKETSDRYDEGGSERCKEA